MGRRIRKGSALMFAVVILLAVSIIASGITMYFYHASLQSNNSNFYAEKHIELENEFNKKFNVVLTQVSTTTNEEKVKEYFNSPLDPSRAFSEGDFYTTIRYKGETSGTQTFTYEVETSYKRRECHLIKTIRKTDATYIVDVKEVYYVTTSN